MACWWVVCTKPVRLVGRGGGGVGEITKFHKKHLKKNVQEKMWKHQKTYKQSENVVSTPPQKVMLLPHVPLLAGAHTRTQTHPDTGIRFLVKIHWLQNINYLSASSLQSSYHTCTAFLLKIDPQAVACRCFAEEFITSVMHCCVACRHKHTT